MNLSHLETFVYAARFKSFHKAADALFLSQPTVSARIKSLERELGSELFIRQGRGVLLTEDGKEFNAYAEQILQLYSEGKKRIKENNNDKEIVIGANEMISQYFIPHALPLWKKTNPLIKFKFVNETDEVLKEKLLRKKIDIAFTTDMKSKEITQRQLLTNEVKLIASPNHALRDEVYSTINRISEEKLVYCDWGMNDQNQIYNLFTDSKIEPRIACHVNHIEVAKSLIKNEKAIGFLPEISIKSEIENGDLIEISSNHLFQIEQPVFIAFTNPEVLHWKLLNDMESTAKAFQLS